MTSAIGARLGTGALALACALVAVQSNAATVHTAKRSAHRALARSTPRPAVAPADEYFGRTKMSILGVRIKVRDLGLQADLHPDEDLAVLTTALYVEDAMRDWARKYPYDRWLPRYAYALETMYEHIPGDDAHKRAIRQINYIIAYFPASNYAKVGRSKLVDGVPTPDPAASAQADSALQRLALLDGRVQPTIPPAAPPTTAPDEAAAGPAPSATLEPLATPSPLTPPIIGPPGKVGR